MVQPRGDRPADSVALWFYTDRLEEMHAALRKQKAPTGFSRAMT